MFGGGGPPVITNIGTNLNNSGATLTITGVTVPAGALIFVGICEYASGDNTTGGTVADGVNAGNYAAGTALANGDNPSYIQYRGFGRYHYIANSSALSSATITYTKNTSGSAAVMSAFYVTGIAAVSPLDTAVSASNNDSTSTNPLFTLTSGTPSVSGELFVALVTTDGGSWFAQDTANSWATPPVLVYNTLNGTGQVAGGTQINAGTGTKAFAPGNTSGASRNWAAWVLGFKPA